MRRHVQGIFSIDSWLEDDIEPASPTDEIFKQHFTAWLQTEDLAEAEGHRLFLETLVKQRSVTVQKRDLARFWFQNGCLLTLEDRYIDAFDAFGFCATFIPKDDWAARLQVLVSWTHVKMHLMYFTVAIDDYLEIVTILKEHDGIHFRSGSSDALRCNAHTQAAICYMRLGFFSVASPHIQQAIDLLNVWVSAQSDDGSLDLSVPLSPVPFLALAEMPRSVLESRSPEVTVWIMLHNTAVWAYGWIQYWRCRLSRAREEPLRELHQYIEWVHDELTAHFDEAHRIGDYDSLPPGLQHLFRQTAAMSMFCAEAIFLLCQEGEMPLENALILADNFISLAQDAHVQTHVDHQYKYFHYTSDLMEVYREWWEIEQQGQAHAANNTTALTIAATTKLQDLIRKFSKMHAADFLAAKNHVIRHFEGRYRVLLGQLYLAIGDETHADPVLEAAEDIFTNEGSGGDLLRKMEAQRLLKQDDEFIDDEPLDDWDDADDSGMEGSW